MHSFCGNVSNMDQEHRIGGAVVESRGNFVRNLDCIVTFQTDSILRKFMLRFDLLELNQNDHLYIYDGMYGLVQEFSSIDSNHTVGLVFTRSHTVTIKFVSGGWGTEYNGFRLIITAVKNPG